MRCSSTPARHHAAFGADSVLAVAPRASPAVPRKGSRISELGFAELSVSAHPLVRGVDLQRHRAQLVGAEAHRRCGGKANRAWSSRTGVMICSSWLPFVTGGRANTGRFRGSGAKQKASGAVRRLFSGFTHGGLRRHACTWRGAGIGSGLFGAIDLPGVFCNDDGGAEVSPPAALCSPGTRAQVVVGIVRDRDVARGTPKLPGAHCRQIGRTASQRKPQQRPQPHPTKHGTDN